MIISASVDEKTLEMIDDLEKSLGLKGRSEILRISVRKLFEENQKLDSLKETGNFILITLHRRKDEKKLESIKHNYRNVIKTQLHNDIDTQKCANLFILEGESKRIVSMYKDLQKMDLEKVSLTSMG